MLLAILICLVMPPVIIYSGLKMMWPTKKDPNAQKPNVEFRGETREEEDERINAWGLDEDWSINNDCGLIKKPDDQRTQHKK